MEKILIKLAALLVITVFLTSCGDEDPVVEPAASQNIVEVAQANGFNALASALTRAGLVDDLQADGTFTVFAPTDEAFDALLAAVGQTSVDDVPVPVLEQILLYHVLGNTVLSTQISDGDVATLESSNVTLNTANGVSVNGANVTTPDVQASNGVIHIIDAVLVPSDVAQFVNTVLEPAYFNKNFTTLIEAAVKADLVSTLLSTDDITIFAPTNAAFEASGIDPSAVDAATLANVLKYHVVPDKVMSSGIPRNAGALSENQLYFSLIDAGNFINGGTEITAVDIESGSGIVHVIDAVLLPYSGNVVETAIDLTADGEFTSLVAALQRTADEGTADQNLLTVLSGDGPFTVFAPTNAAFQALLDSSAEWTTLNDIPLATLVDVLLYHVVPARAFDKDLAGAIDTSNQLETALTQSITFDLTNLTINSNVNITGVNTTASNGVIHVIDAVLLP